jgi:lipopolysaccharide transport system ATP-binding protein
VSVAISIEHLTKTYRLGEIGGSTLSADVSRWWARLRGQPDPFSRVDSVKNSRQREQVFRALHDVSFDVREGDVVGIIGRNGAGKSTLLKVLSQVTSPTIGRISIRGRIASLLEVGTGFHPELTGRENIFLNGAILGMTRIEVRKKFDEIVAFSECAEFIDTPVKRYSSGMYVRLAFAVAAHLEPEILIVDEVLAVGDAQFQRKCLGKMSEVGRSGRTILFVSHTMAAITRLCTRAVLLDKGAVVIDGSVEQVVGRYLSRGDESPAVREWSAGADAPGNENVGLLSVKIVTEHHEVAHSLDIRRPIGIELCYDVTADGVVLVPSIQIFNTEGVCAFAPHDWNSEWRRRPRPKGRYHSTCWIPGNFMAEGTFTVSVGLATYVPFKVHVLETDVVSFEVIDTVDGTTARGDWAGSFPGVVRPILQWATRLGNEGPLR